MAHIPLLGFPQLSGCGHFHSVIKRHLNLGFRLCMLEFGQPTAPHRVVDEVVAQPQDVQVAAFRQVMG